MKSWFNSKILLGLASALLVVACSQSAGSGGPALIPQFVINCTTPLCNSNSSPIVHVLITPFKCDPLSDNLAVASTSMVINCTMTAGCYGTTSAWVNDKGEAITTVTDGTYTVCGRIDYNHNYPGTTNDDTTSINENVAISGASSGPVNLSIWTDP